MNDSVQTLTTQSADGTAICYHLMGSGSLNLVWMGQGGPFELMLDDPGFTRIVKRLRGFCRLITIEPRGFGSSEGDHRDFYVDEVSDADFTAVLDALGVEKASVMGWSTTGGRVIRFAVAHPERTSSLILVNSCAHYVREPDYPWGFPRESLDSIASSLEKAWGSPIDLEITAPSRIGDERLRTWWGRSRRATYAPTPYAEVFRLSLESDVRALLPSISVPTLVLHREGDRLIHLGAGRYLGEHIPGAKFVVLPGDDHLIFAGDVDQLLDEIEVFVTGTRSGAEANVVTANILFTDVVGSTEQQARLGPREWSRLTDEHDALTRELLNRHHGREVKTTGDGFLAVFEAAGRSLRCATEIIAAAKRAGLDLRAGVHTGDVELRGDDIGGLPVSIAKRVCDLAPPGEVLVSETVRSLLTGSSFGFVERGEHDLKGVPGVWKLFAVRG